MISGDLDYMKKEKLQELREELGDVERMLKAMIKSPILNIGQFHEACFDSQ